MTTAQNNTKGILFILVGMVVFSIQDALIKFIYEDSALYELYLGRTLSAAFFLFCYMKFINEKVGIRRWLAILTGFIGVFIVLNPDFSDFEYKKLAPIACALCYSISMTITKYTSDKDNSYTQMTHLYIGATIISILFFIFTGEGQFNNFSDPTYQFIFREWFTNPSYAWPIIILMGFNDWLYII